MRTIILISILLASLLLFGCSQGVVSPDSQAEAPLQSVQSRESNQWIWGRYTVLISEDHTQADLIPVRNSDWHLNVTKFVEKNPCHNCLQIGQPVVQPDGTLMINVWLSHPYPLNPEYTGFDVRGVLVFKATDYIHHLSSVRAEKKL